MAEGREAAQMKRLVVRRKKRQLKPFGNPRYKDSRPIEPGTLKEYKPPEDMGARAAEYLEHLKRDRIPGARGGMGAWYLRTYLPGIASATAIKMGKEYLEEHGPIKREPKYEVIEGGAVPAVPTEIAHIASSGAEINPFDIRGKTARPIAFPRKSKYDRVPPIVGPVQNAMALATQRYNHYKDQYDWERERDPGHINIELKRKVELYGKLTRDIRTLLELLRSETQASFEQGLERRQKAKVRRLGMLERAMKMVVG